VKAGDDEYFEVLTRSAHDHNPPGRIEPPANEHNLARCSNVSRPSGTLVDVFLSEIVLFCYLNRVLVVPVSAF